MLNVDSHHGVTRFLVCALLATGVDLVSSSKGSARLTLPSSVSDYADASKLYVVLLRNYISNVPPFVGDATPMIVIKLEFSLIDVSKLDDYSQELSITYVILKGWHDPRLTWNQSSHGGINEIYLPSDKIWTPDISLLNLQNQEYGHTYGDKIIVNSTGYVLWYPRRQVRVSCMMGTHAFPHDTQTCELRFLSWIYTSEQLGFELMFGSGLNETAISVENDIHQGWELTSAQQKVTSNTSFLGLYVDSYPLLTVTLNLKRLAEYDQTVYVVPAVLLGSLIPVVFLLPPDSNEKTTLGGLIMLGLCVLLLNIQDLMMPSYSKHPKIAVYYLSAMVLTSISLVGSAIVTALARKPHKRRSVPAWLNNFVLGRNGLRRLVWVGAFTHQYDAVSTHGTELLADSEPPAREMVQPVQAQTPTTHNKELREIKQLLLVISARITSDEAFSGVTRQWYEIARVLDRLLFFIFCILVIMIFLTTLT